MTKSTSPARRTRIRAAAAIAVLAAAATTAVFALTMNDSADHNSATERVQSGPSAPPNQELLALARRDGADPMALGRADAPVVMIEYSDFQCPFCGKFARDTKPELLRSYVDKGVLRIEWRSFPIFGKESERAALASWAAGQQKKFWEFHDVAYSKERKRNTGEFSDEKLVDMARKAGVKDLERFKADLNSNKAREALRTDKNEAHDLGVTSTPAFLINGQPILGAQPTSTFKDVIEAAAKEAAK
ncbi:DsbA family protein [Streptomyces noursei]|uniref:DsbA family protein n=1 Tax=Streptomyces TaxID=1883 RepID=UPI0035DA1D10